MSLLTQFYPGPGGGDISINSLEVFGSGAGGGLILTDPSPSDFLVPRVDITTTNASAFAGLPPSVLSQGSSGLILANYETPAGFLSGPGSFYAQGGYFIGGYNLNGWITNYTVNTGGFRQVVGSNVVFAAAGASTPSLVGVINAPQAVTWSGLSFLAYMSGGTGSGSGIRPSWTLNAPNLVTLDNLLFQIGGPINGAGVPGGAFNCNNSPNLANLTNLRVGVSPYAGPAPNMMAASVISIQGAALTLASVSSVLASVKSTDSSVTLSGLSILLDGGTSAGTSQLTPADITNLSACVARGVTIQLNA